MSNDKPYIKLTKTEQLILNSYKKMIVSLGEYLGEGYEIILHSLENLQHSVIENVNGHYSGRKNGAPITDLALSMLSQLKEEPSQPAVCYMNHSKKLTVPAYCGLSFLWQSATHEFYPHGTVR